MRDSGQSTTQMLPFTVLRFKRSLRVAKPTVRKVLSTAQHTPSFSNRPTETLSPEKPKPHSGLCARAASAHRAKMAPGLLGRGSPGGHWAAPGPGHEISWALRTVFSPQAEVRGTCRVPVYPGAHGAGWPWTRLGKGLGWGPCVLSRGFSSPARPHLYRKGLPTNSTLLQVARHEKAKPQLIIAQPLGTAVPPVLRTGPVLERSAHPAPEKETHPPRADTCVPELPWCWDFTSSNIAN